MKYDWPDDEVNSIRSVVIPKKSLIRDRVPLPESPSGTLDDGRSDFRGFPLSTMASVNIDSANFSFCRSPINEYGVDQLIMLTNVQCNNVIFDRSRVFHRIDGNFSRCSFQKIGTSQSSLVGTFSECDFTGTSFRNAHFVANFRNCNFSNCNLNLASWGSSFEECSFTGSKIHDLFADVRDVAMSSELVTFCVVGDTVKPGETRHI